MNKEKAKNITQLDYIKVLIEDDRIGEALNYINILSNTLNNSCEITVENFNKCKPIEITKDQLKTKPGNWVYLRNSWLKLISKDKNIIHLEVSKNIEIKMSYKIVNEKQPSTNK